MALGVEGVRVGVWTSPNGPSGCTVILPPPGTVGAIAVRGAAPGTREAVALSPQGRIEVCHAVVLSGGSAFGLASADGVATWLEARGIGHPVARSVVPIVGAAIVLDQGATDPAVRPGPQAGTAACDAATEDDPAEGSVGAGAGVTVAKVAGLGYAWRSGQGIAVHRDGEVVVGALVVNNAVGEVFDDHGNAIVASRAAPDAPRYPSDPDAILNGLDLLADHLPAGPATVVAPPTDNTVIGCIVTNARLTKLGAVRVADLGHSGIARSIRPAHTSLDGDALFTLATGQVESTIDLVAELAAEAVAEATRRGPLAAIGGHGLPGHAAP